MKHSKKVNGWIIFNNQKIIPQFSLQMNEEEQYFNNRYILKRIPYCPLVGVFGPEKGLKFLESTVFMIHIPT